MDDILIKNYHYVYQMILLDVRLANFWFWYDYRMYDENEYIKMQLNIDYKFKMKRMNRYM